MTAVAVLVLTLVLACVSVGLITDHTAQPPDRSAEIAASARRIVTLHRELGISPIYDPIPAELPKPEPEPAPRPDVVGEEFVNDQHVMSIYTCPRCMWAMSSSKELATASFKRHWQDKHADWPANGAPADYDG